MWKLQRLEYYVPRTNAMGKGYAEHLN